MLHFHYFFKKIIQTIPTLLGVTLLCFIIFYIIGGDPALQLAGKHATSDQIDLLRKELQLDQNIYKQYFLFLRQSFLFDWGHSLHTHENINQMILSRLKPSLMITIPGFVFSLLVSLILGLLASFHHNRPTDNIVVLTSMILMSISFLVYIILFQYLFAFKLGFFPVTGWSNEYWLPLRHLTLPWIIYTLATMAPNLLIFRSAFIEQKNQDYVRTARSKGLSEKIIYTKHIFKNALIPIVTVAMIQIPFLITGTLLIESYFGIPGIGNLVIQAMQTADFPVVKAMTVIGSLIYILFNLLTDFLYVFLDTRIKLQ